MVEATQEITMTIDGQEVKTTSGKMVIQAANDAGVYIPYLCYHPGMEPYGACRMCVVDVEGPRGTATLASCTLPVTDGMVVHTTADKPKAVRDTTLDLLLSEHPNGCLTCHRVDLCGPQDICLRHVDVTDRCVTCPKNERCELKDTTRYHTQGLASPLNFQYRELQVETKDPFYDRDYNLCIVCARCVRACDELRGDSALTMTERAGQVLVGTVMGDSLLEAGCEFCGACLDVCPVGALTETKYKWERPVRTEQSVCAECPVGCTMTYEVNRWDKVIRTIPELNAPVNLGQACFKGKFGFDYVNDKRRLSHPLVRRDGQLQEATWDEAIRAAAEGLAPHKGEGFALITSPRDTNEELYVAGKFARAAMASNNVDISSNDRPGVVEGLQDVFGYFAGTMSLADLRGAAVSLVVSSNMTEEQNVAAVAIKQAVRAGTQKLIVIDHREVELTRSATMWLRPYPGTDEVLMGGLLRAVIDSDLANAEFVAERCDGWDAMIASLEPFRPDAVAEVTGISIDQIERAAYLYASEGPAVILFALDSSRPGSRRTTSRAIANLALVTGNVGVPNAGVLPLYHGANDQGAWDMGIWPSSLPGHELLQDPEALARFSKLWGAELPAAPGLGHLGMFSGASEGRIKAMLLLGDHVHYEDGTFGDVTSALDRLEFLVVTDAFLSEAAQRADVVFPAAQWAEKLGTYTNLERRVQPLVPVVEPKSSAVKSDLEIIGAIAMTMGARGFSYTGPRQVLEEISSVVPFYAGISYDRLMAEAVPTPKPGNDNPQPTQVLYSDAVRHGIQWPCTSADEPGTPFLYGAVFRYGKAALGVLYGEEEQGVRVWPGRPAADEQFPLRLAHGRVLAQLSRPAEVEIVNGQNRIGRIEELHIHPDDAANAGVESGQPVVATTESGREVHGVVCLSEAVLPGVVSLTTLFGELMTQVQASERPDAMNYLPRLNSVPVRLDPA